MDYYSYPPAIVVSRSVNSKSIFNNFKNSDTHDNALNQKEFGWLQSRGLTISWEHKIVREPMSRDSIPSYSVYSTIYSHNELYNDLSEQEKAMFDTKRKNAFSKKFGDKKETMSYSEFNELMNYLVDSVFDTDQNA